MNLSFDFPPLFRFRVGLDSNLLWGFLLLFAIIDSNPHWEVFLWLQWDFSPYVLNPYNIVHARCCTAGPNLCTICMMLNFSDNNTLHCLTRIQHQSIKIFWCSKQSEEMEELHFLLFVICLCKLLLSNMTKCNYCPVWQELCPVKIINTVNSNI